MERRSEIGGVKQSLTESSYTRSLEKDSMAQACRSQDISFRHSGRLPGGGIPALCQPKQRKAGGYGTCPGGGSEGRADEQQLGGAPRAAPSHPEWPGRTPMSQLTLPRTSEVELLFPFTRGEAGAQRQRTTSPRSHSSHPRGLQQPGTILGPIR